MLSTEVQDRMSHVPERADAAMSEGGAWGVLEQYWPWILGLVTLLSRLLYTSAPYYVDGPSHVRAIETGAMFIQPPGYLLFAEMGRAVAGLLRVSPAGALHAINVVASAGGAAVFALLTRRVFGGVLGMVLAACYAFSDVTWFVSEVHSTYALSASLVVVLLWLSWREDAGWWMGLVWAVQAGVRPSEGVFVLPFVLLVLWQRGVGERWRAAGRFAAVAVPVALLWYAPTVRHFGGGLLAPLSSAKDQAGSLANGILSHETMPKKLANLIHIGTSVADAWNVLAIFLVAGAVWGRAQWTRSLLALFALPLLFYSLWFFSDPAYLAFLVAPGVLLAGEGLRRLPARRQVLAAGVALGLSVGQMMLCRPIAVHSPAQAVVNSYVLEYSGWAIRHQYFVRLKTAMAAVGNKG